MPRHHLFLSCPAVLAFLVLSGLAPAQTDPLYMSDGDGHRIFVVQGGTIVQTFPAMPAIRAFPIAVVDTVRISGYAPGEIGGEYTLAGVPTGTTYPLNQGDNMSDGTTDGVVNYGISFTGNVWRYDRNWANGMQIWSAPGHAGIAYDATDNTLWLSADRAAGISHYTVAGAFLGAFTTAGNLDWNLALEPSTQTLWVSSRSTQSIHQYTKGGVLVATHPIIGLVPSSFVSGEFPLVSITAEITSVVAADSTVRAGTTGHPVTVTLATSGMANLTIDALTLTFTGTLDRTSEYVVTPAPANPTVIPALGSVMLDFTVDVAPGASLELITLDASASVRDPSSGAMTMVSGATSTDTWQVVDCLAPTCGDCNGDMVVSILDALTAAQHGAAIITLAGTAFSQCNVFGALEPDPAAVVSILDALVLAQSAAGLPVTVTCC